MRRGWDIRVKDALYSLSDRVVTEQATLAEATLKYPNSVFCLLTALRIHELTTQSAHQVWLAVDTRRY